MSVQQEIVEKLKELNPKAILLSELQNALIGVGKHFADGESNFYAVYDFEKLIFELKNKFQLSRTEAIEYYDFNIANTGGSFYTIILYKE